MKKELLKEVKKLLDNKELTREEVLLELFTDEDGDLHLFWLDFSNFEGNVWMSGLKVKSSNKAEGNLYQSVQRVKGDYYATSIKVKGEIDFEEPTKMLKKITLKELKEMGYELEEGK